MTDGTKNPSTVICDILAIGGSKARSPNLHQPDKSFPTSKQYGANGGGVMMQYRVFELRGLQSAGTMNHYPGICVSRLLEESEPFLIILTNCHHRLNEPHVLSFSSNWVTAGRDP